MTWRCLIFFPLSFQDIESKKKKKNKHKAAGRGTPQGPRVVSWSVCLGEALQIPSQTFLRGLHEMPAQTGTGVCFI